MTSELAQSGLYVECGGDAGPVLLLIHGLASNGAVWDKLLPLVKRDWKGGYLAPDLRGHGRSPHTTPYSFGTFTADLASLIDKGQQVAVIGHSLGGVLGALLATGWFGVDVRSVLALSVKTVWSEEELSKFFGVGEQPVRWMDSQADAETRYLKSSGLVGLADPSARVVQRSIVEQGGKFRFAADQAVYGSTGHNVPGILHAGRSPVHFATGGGDVMAPVDQHQPCDAEAAVIPEAGHQVHLERPEEVWRLFQTHWAKDIS